MRCLDLKIIKFEPNFYLLEPYQCGYASPVISADIDIEVYVKYEIPRWTYHDRMHIKVMAEEIQPIYEYIGEDDIYIIEDVNPSDDTIVREKTIRITFGYYDIGGGVGDDYRRSGWRKWKFVFFTDSGGPRKTITVQAYWDTESCKFTDYEVEGVEQSPPTSESKFTIIDFKADKTVIMEGETVTVTATIKNTSNTTGSCLVNLYIDDDLITGRTLFNIHAGESREITFEIEDLSRGKHRVCIEISEVA